MTYKSNHCLPSWGVITKVVTVLLLILILAIQTFTGIGLAETPVKESNLDKTTWFSLRPISTGIYNFGDLLKTGLTVSDRPGKLDVSGTTIGVLNGVNLKFRFAEKSPFFIFMAGDYKWNKITKVALPLEDSFTVTGDGNLVQPSTLPEFLYDGGVKIRWGVSVEF